MNLDELQSIRDRERQSDSLQQLRETFYEDAGELVAELRAERKEAAAAADDPFDAPEVNKLTDDIKTAEQTVEAIYERRVGKLVKMASFAAADMPTEDEGLTVEERALFEHLVEAIEHNREHVLGVLDGDLDLGSAVPDGLPGGGESTTTSHSDSQDASGEQPVPPDPEPPDGIVEADEPAADTDAESSSGVDAADLMAGDPGPNEEETAGDSAHPVPPTDQGSGADLGGDADDASESGAAPETSDGPTAAGEHGTGDEGTDVPGGPETAGEESVTVDRATVRITQDVGEIFGVDQRNYDLSREDVVSLPAENADLLVEKDAAERLDE